MGCCGEKRTTWRLASASSSAPPAVTATAPPASPQVARGDVRVRYLERSTVRVRGAATGRVYTFSAAAPFQLVDRRDARLLLASRFFEGRA